MVLRSMFACGHFKHKGDAQQSLLSFSVGHHLAKTNKDKKGTEGEKVHLSKCSKTFSNSVHYIKKVQKYLCAQLGL